MGKLDDQIADLRRFNQLAARRASGQADYVNQAPDEHLAYAEGLTREDPLNALGLGLIAAPGYYLAKKPLFRDAAIKYGLINADSTQSTLGQLAAAYKGIGRGLKSADWSNTGMTVRDQWAEKIKNMLK